MENKQIRECDVTKGELNGTQYHLFFVTYDMYVMNIVTT